MISFVPSGGLTLTRYEREVSRSIARACVAGNAATASGDTSTAAELDDYKIDLLGTLAWLHRLNHPART
ncbi:MAG: hypothetical protein AAF449_03340 [Myxococcota bacterium]